MRTPTTAHQSLALLHKMVQGARLPLGIPAVAPGNLVLPELGFSLSEDAPRRKGRLIAVDDKLEMEREAQRLINKAYTKLRHNSAPLFNGLYFCPTRLWDELTHSVQELRDAARPLNARSYRMGVRRELRIELYKFPLNTDAKTLVRMGQAIYWRLYSLRGAIVHREKEDRTKFQMEWRLCWNLDQVLQGDQRVIVRTALDHAELQRTEKVSQGDYSRIDAAMSLFEEAKDAFTFKPVKP